MNRLPLPKAKPFQILAPWRHNLRARNNPSRQFPFSLFINPKTSLQFSSNLNSTFSTICPNFPFPTFPIQISTMVVPLGPGKFYGSSLPRPRYYTDVKLNDERVDPPTPVLDPLLSWANEAHWSMGGLSFNRLRLQGRIEGNINKLRAEREKDAKKKLKAKQLDSAPTRSDPDGEADSDCRLKTSKSASPPPAPIATKRRRLMALFDDEDDVDMYKEDIGVVKRRLVKKLGDDFDRVAAESKRNQLKGSRNRSLEISGIGESVMKIVEGINDENTKGKKMNSERKGKSGGTAESGSVSGIRSSPRLANKRGFN